MTPTTQRILFVRSGGGLPGLDIHAGIWLALQERGIVPTEVVGTSAGAIISALQAAGRPADFAAAVVGALTDRDVRRELPFWKFRVPWLDHFLANEPVLSLLEALLPASWAQMQLPFSAWATRRATGQAVNVADPNVSRTPSLAALASMSIRGIFPAVRLEDGHSYIDGGVRCNLPLPLAWQEYDQVWLLIATTPPGDYTKQRGIVTNLLTNVGYLMQDQIEDVLFLVRNEPRVRIIWPKLHSAGGMLHFEHSLIRQAYTQSLKVIDMWSHPA